MFRRLFEPVALLRLALGAMYLYSGTDIVRHPSAWHWAIRQTPQFIEDIIGQIGLDQFLVVQGYAEIALGAVFLIWFLPRVIVKLAAALSSLQLAAILLLVGVDGITFRDLAALGAALALYRMKS
jgi:uncharacterized membrane protein YphA (DoxX/SURF4 family)